MSRWRLLVTGAGAPAGNMGLDEALLESVDERPALRLYGWRPAALSLGYFQPVEPFVPLAERAGAVLVRRPTGGGAIHHDDELTFAIAACPGADGYPARAEDAYALVHDVVRAALASLGVEVRPRGGDAPRSTRPRDATLCFHDTTAFDLVDGAGRKLVGSAQRRSGPRVLHHGSIPLSVPALSPGCAAVSALAGRRVPFEELGDAVLAAFAERLGAVLERQDPTPREAARARQLAATRYADPRERPARDRGGLPATA